MVPDKMKQNKPVFPIFNSKLKISILLDDWMDFFTF